MPTSHANRDYVANRVSGNCTGWYSKIGYESGRFRDNVRGKHSGLNPPDVRSLFYEFKNKVNCTFARFLALRP